MEDISGSPYTVQTVLNTRFLALAILDVCHLLSGKLYISHFLSAYTNRVMDPSLRPPNREEAESADRQAWVSICRLVTSGVQWDQAIHEVVVVRELFLTYLQPRPRARSSRDSAPIKRPFKEDNHHRTTRKHHRSDHRDGKGSRGSRSHKDHRQDRQHKDHRDDRRGGKSGGKKGGKDSPNKSKFCFKFQNGSCSKSAEECSYKHSCQNCNRPGHGSVNCTS